MARVKRCGKSTPVLLVTMNAGKPLGARLSRDDDVVKLKAILG